MWFTYDGRDVWVPILEPGEPPSKGWLSLLASAIQSDGCSGVPDFYLGCCIVHDLAYKFQVDPWGRPLTRAAADAALRECIQGQSRWGKLSPMSWWRWAGVRMAGWKPWKAHRSLQTAPGKG